MPSRSPDKVTAFSSEDMIFRDCFCRSAEESDSFFLRPSVIRGLYRENSPFSNK